MPEKNIVNFLAEKGLTGSPDTAAAAFNIIKALSKSGYVITSTVQMPVVRERLTGNNLDDAELREDLEIIARQQQKYMSEKVHS